MPAVAREHFDGGARDARLGGSVGPLDASLTVTAGGLTTWPDGSVGRIPIILSPGLAEEEHAYATGRTGDTLTGLVRGQDGTSPNVHAAGAVLRHGLHAAHVDAANAFLSAPTAAGQIAVSAGPDEWVAGDLPAGVPLDAPSIVDFTDAQHLHNGPGAGGTLLGGPPTASAVGDTPVEGVGEGYSRDDHRHGRESFGAPGASAPGDTAASGASESPARADHRHGREAFATTTTTLPTPMGSATPGVTNTVARGDHTHDLPEFGASVPLPPTTSSDQGAVSELAARASHTHGLPVQAGTVTIVVAGSNAGVGTVTFAKAHTAAPVVQLTVEVGSNLDVIPNIVSRTATGFTYRVFSNSGSAFSGTVRVHWFTYGEVAP